MWDVSVGARILSLTECSRNILTCKVLALELPLTPLEARTVQRSLVRFPPISGAGARVLLRTAMSRKVLVAAVVGWLLCVQREPVSGGACLVERRLVVGLS